MCLQALALFQQAMEDGHFKQQRWDASGAQRAEVRTNAALEPMKRPKLHG